MTRYQKVDFLYKFDVLSLEQKAQTTQHPVALCGVGQREVQAARVGQYGQAAVRIHQAGFLEHLGLRAHTDRADRVEGNAGCALFFPGGQRLVEAGPSEEG